VGGAMDPGLAPMRQANFDRQERRGEREHRR
jgi:hypothetical protein